MRTETIIIICVLSVLILFLLIRSKNTVESYPMMCEFQEECLGDAAKTVQLSNGMAGNCVLNGMACPAFMPYEDDYDYANIQEGYNDIYKDGLWNKYGQAEPQNVWRDNASLWLGNYPVQ